MGSGTVMYEYEVWVWVWGMVVGCMAYGFMVV